MSPFRSSNWSSKRMKLKLERRRGSTSLAGRATTDPRSTSVGEKSTYLEVLWGDQCAIVV